MTFNQFTKELERRGIDQQTAFMLATVYERLIQQQKLIEDQASVLVQFANQLQGFVQLHGRTQEGLQRVMKGNRPDGVELGSVANDPEDEPQKH